MIRSNCTITFGEPTPIRFYYKHRKIFFNKIIPRFLRFGKTVIERDVNGKWEEIAHCHKISSKRGIKTVVNIINNPHVYILVEDCEGYVTDAETQTFYIL